MLCYLSAFMRRAFVGRSVSHGHLLLSVRLVSELQNVILPCIAAPMSELET